MTEILSYVSDALILLGAFFTLTGAIGMLRMPDFFTRLHPAGLKDSAGVPLVIIGLMIKAGLTLISFKLLLLMLFLLLTNPAATHALAKSALLARDKGADKGTPGT